MTLILLLQTIKRQKKKEKSRKERKIKKKKRELKTIVKGRKKQYDKTSLKNRLDGIESVQLNRTTSNIHRIVKQRKKTKKKNEKTMLLELLKHSFSILSINDHLLNALMFVSRSSVK